MTGTFGDFTVASVLDFYFPTVRDTGAPFTLAGTPAVSVYKDNSTTQSTSGVSLDVDFDSVTVTFYDFSIPTSTHLTAFEGGATWMLSTRSGGAWTDTNTRRPSMGLLISGLDLTAAGGGEVSVPFVG